MSVSISVGVHGNAIEMLQTTLAARTQKIDRAIQKAGLNCQKIAKKAAPVGTPESTGIKGYKGGRLRASIMYQGGYLSCTVTTNVNYSKFVEFGTRYMKARPYMTPAYMAAGKQLQQELSDL